MKKIAYLNYFTIKNDQPTSMNYSFMFGRKKSQRTNKMFYNSPSLVPNVVLIVTAIALLSIHPNSEEMRLLISL